MRRHVVRAPSERELRVLALLANGHTMRSAAEEMGIAEQTVKNHLHNAYRALGVGNRQGAFLELGWLIPPEIE